MRDGQRNGLQPGQSQKSPQGGVPQARAVSLDDLCGGRRSSQLPTRVWLKVGGEIGGKGLSMPGMSPITEIT